MNKEEIRKKNKDGENKSRSFGVIRDFGFLIFPKPQAGFSMLFAVLTSSLVLSIGISIFNLTLKEITLSSSGRESQFAFYAADSGIECALYWDFRGAFRSPIADPAVDPICNGNDPRITETNGNTVIGNYPYVSTEMAIELPGTGGQSSTCSSVFITKVDEGGGFISTTIESRGYNINDNDSDPHCFSSNRDILVERALRVEY